jgi:ribosome recycling factor
MAQTEKPDLPKYRDRMDKAVDALREEFSSLRTGRASASLLDQVTVEAYGSTMPLNQCGSVSVPEPRSITVSVWDKGLVVSVEKAIRNAGLGFNPVVEGQNLRIPVPPLTEERRKDLVKVAGKYTEQQKVAIRNVRRDANDQIKAAQKDAVITEDDLKRMEKEIQEFTDAAIKRADEALKTKEQEIMQV